MKSVDPITFQIVNTRLSGIVQEMQRSLFRTGFSTIIRESQDASCAILDTQGEIVAQHVVLPLHMGAFPACLRELLNSYPLEEMSEGDAFLVNHPYRGGSPHVPDMAVITPVVVEGEVAGFCANMAHKTDMGGAVPGSCPAQAREVYLEGILIPPIRYVSRFETSREVERILAANSRTPDLVLGDIRGQVGANRLGEMRMKKLISEYGLDTVFSTFSRLFDVTEQRVRSEILNWKNGTFFGEGFLDNDGIDLMTPVRIHVRVEKEKDRILFDFSGSAEQTAGPANIRPPLVQAVCYYCLISLIDPYLPNNYGLARVVETRFRKGSVLDPRFPAPVNAYMMTAHMVTEVVFEALGRITPERRVAASAGSRSITLAGKSSKTGQGYLQFELFAGGTGGRFGKDGVSGSPANVSNCCITPVEILESEFPIWVDRFELIPDSAGAGEYRGGLGFLREYSILDDKAIFSSRGDQFLSSPKGIDGGKAGRPGFLSLNPETAEFKSLPARNGGVPLEKGDVIQLGTPGGGGWGDPMLRDPERVLRDVRNGYISCQAALELFGVVVRKGPEDYILDLASTRGVRQSRQDKIRKTNSIDKFVGP